MVRKAALQQTNRKDSARNEGHFLRCRERGDGKQSGIWQQQRWSYDLRRSETTMCLSQKRSLIQYSSCKMKECKWRFFRAEITDARTSKRWTVWKCHWQIWWINLLRTKISQPLILPSPLCTSLSRYPCIPEFPPPYIQASLLQALQVCVRR